MAELSAPPASPRVMIGRLKGVRFVIPGEHQTHHTARKAAVRWLCEVASVIVDEQCPDLAVGDIPWPSVLSVGSGLVLGKGCAVADCLADVQYWRGENLCWRHAA